MNVFEISDGSGTLTVSYGGLSYVCRVLELHKNAGTGTAEKNLANVAEAIYLYSIAADNYFVTEG